MKAGYIALFAILGVALAAAAAYCWHRRQLRKQKKRYKRMFVQQVAQRVDLASSVSQLSPDVLAAEFQRIDKGLRSSSSRQKDGGYITRPELWEFVSSGKAGEISEKDFDALFDAMDVKKRGKVNFVEFCAFFSACGDEVREVHAEKKKRDSILFGRSRRLSSAAKLEKSAVTLSMIGNNKVDVAAAAAVAAN